MLSSSLALAVAPVDSSATPGETEAAPAENPWAGIPTIEGSPDGDNPQAQKFLFITGSNLHPRNDTAFTYAGFGCIRPVGTTDFFVIDLQLPSGVEIDFLRLYYYDATGTGTVSGYLSEYDGQGGFTDIFSTTSTTNTGYGSVGDFFSYTVNTTTNSVSILARTSSVSADLRICGIRLRYQDSELFRDGFETGDTSRWSVTAP